MCVPRPKDGVEPAQCTVEKWFWRERKGSDRVIMGIKLTHIETAKVTNSSKKKRETKCDEKFWECQKLFFIYEKQTKYNRKSD